MRSRLQADTIKLDSDEKGFYLEVESDEGDFLEIRMHNLAEDLFGQVMTGVGVWLAERDAAVAAMPRREEDPEAYSVDDPKRWDR